MSEEKLNRITAIDKYLEKNYYIAHIQDKCSCTRGKKCPFQRWLDKELSQDELDTIEENANEEQDIY